MSYVLYCIGGDDDVEAEGTTCLKCHTPVPKKALTSMMDLVRIGKEAVVKATSLELSGLYTLPSPALKSLTQYPIHRPNKSVTTNNKHNISPLSPLLTRIPSLSRTPASA